MRDRRYREILVSVVSCLALVGAISAPRGTDGEESPCRTVEPTDLSTIDTTVKHRVRGVYITPKDRPFRACLADRLDTFIRMAQRLFQEEMAAAGHWDPWLQGKTFPFEMDAEGHWKVVYMVGVNDASWYHEGWETLYPGTKAFDEMCRRLPVSFGQENVVIFMYDLAVLEDGLVYYAGQGGSGTPWSGEGSGYTLQGSHFLGLGFDTVAVRIDDQAAMFEQPESSTMRDWDGDFTLDVLTRGKYASTDVGAAIHELGHAFYLGHDFVNYGDGRIENNLLGHGFRRLSGRYTPKGYIPPTRLGPLHQSELDAAVLFNEGVPPIELLRDDGEPGTSSTGSWTARGAAYPYGEASLHADDPGATYTFQLIVPVTGTYEVALRWTEREDGVASVPVEIRHAGGTSTVLVDQTRNAGRWNAVGEYPFAGSATVTVRSPGGGSTCADGVKLARVFAPASPMTLVVDIEGSGGFTDIQSAIDAARHGDTVLVKPGEYVITAPIDFNRDRSLLGRGARDAQDPSSPAVKDLVVRSEGGAAVTTIRMAETPADPTRASVSIFESGETGASVLEGFRLTGGKGTGLPEEEGRGGGILCIDSSPTIKGCIIDGNFPATHHLGASGGGVYCSSASPVLDGCTISGNEAPAIRRGDELLAGHGGGIHVAGGSPTLTGCTVTGNKAEQGGGGVSILLGSSATLTACVVSENEITRGCGGGIRCEGSATLIDCTISRNASRASLDSEPSFQGGSGGGVCAEAGGNITLEDCRILQNWSRDGGGVDCGPGSAPTLARCTISANRAYSPCDVESSCQDGLGGGLRCREGSSPVLSSCIISGNLGEAGGGIHSGKDAMPALTNCVVFGNLAYGLGVIWSPTGGGGLFAGDGSSPLLNSCTIRGNSDSLQCAAGAAPVFWNCIVSTAPPLSACATLSSCFLGADAGFVKEGAFDFGRFETVSAAGREYEVPAFIVRSPDYHLRPDSPAIDAADPDHAPATDLDGCARPVGAGPDMGACEGSGCLPAAANVLGSPPDPVVRDREAVAYAGTIALPPGDEWSLRGARFRNVGAGDAAVLVKEARLWREGGDGQPDEPIGPPSTFDAATQEIALEGLDCRIAPGSTMAYLLVCELAEGGAGAGKAGSLPAPAGKLARPFAGLPGCVESLWILAAGACLLALAAGSRRRSSSPARWRLATASALLVFGLWLSSGTGCGGGGGGGGKPPPPPASAELKLELLDLDLCGRNGMAVRVEGLPSTAWAFEG